MTDPLERLGDDYEAVIGLEVHCQLRTDSKLFSATSTTFGAPPNTQVAAYDMGLPGVLPVVNRRAVEFAIEAGLALNADINQWSRFARKNYFYPDLPKGYQISQHEHPLCEDGALEIEVDGDTRRVGIERIHLEEDAGKSTHAGEGGYSLVDLNRCGVPLIEIVSRPDLRTPEGARTYMKRLRDIVVWLGVSDGEMSEGSLRCDANVSVRPVGEEELGTRTELKNINSFKFVRDGLAYEIGRQIELLEAGERVPQESRGFDPDSGETQTLRAKEESEDYRYVPEPDLPPLVVDDEWLEAVEESLPELPGEKRERYEREFEIDADDADVLTSDRDLAEYFESVVDALEDRDAGSPTGAANWIINELSSALNDRDLSVDEAGVDPRDFARVVELVDDETVSSNGGQELLEALVDEGGDPDEIVEERDLEQVSDEGELETIVDEVLEENPEQVEEFRAGGEQVVGWFIGQVMRATGGQANPKVVRELLQEKL